MLSRDFPPLSFMRSTAEKNYQSMCILPPFSPLYEEVPFVRGETDEQGYEMPTREPRNPLLSMSCCNMQPKSLRRCMTLLLYVKSAKYHRGKGAGSVNMTVVKGGPDLC